jgi:glutamine amidotransferase
LVVVLDYGSGNVRSAVRALERVAAERAADGGEPVEVLLSANEAAAVAADGLVVPGVGAFASCMAGLDAVGARSILRQRLAAGRKVLGICVGMQVLFEAGVEHGVETAGLGLLAGRVEQLRAPVIPHMGWNTVSPPDGSVLFAGLAPLERFYFVHSYAVHPDRSATVPAPPVHIDRPVAEAAGTSLPLADYAATLTEHGEPFVSAVESPLISATQFHPEKSGSAGQALLRNWLDSLARPVERTPVLQGES